MNISMYLKMFILSCWTEIPVKVVKFFTSVSSNLLTFYSIKAVETILFGFKFFYFFAFFLKPTTCLYFNIFLFSNFDNLFLTQYIMYKSSLWRKLEQIDTTIGTGLDLFKSLQWNVTTICSKYIKDGWTIHHERNVAAKNQDVIYNSNRY